VLCFIKNQLVLRRTDKSGIPHIGYAFDCERKARAYRQKTGAYIELLSNPLNDILHKDQTPSSNRLLLER
jgi:hypothetical protein